MKETKKIDWHIEGMTCSSCAQTITQYLGKEGVKNINVNYANGQLSALLDDERNEEALKHGLSKMGYRVSNDAKEANKNFWSLELKVALCALLSIPFLLHMFLHLPILHNGYVQLALATPVLWIGFQHFGRAALASIKHLRPNMDVLILSGASAAYIYSLAGMFMIAPNDYGQYLFFETTAVIITLVFSGNLIEHRTVKKTNAALQSLIDLQPGFATRIENRQGKELLNKVRVEDLFVSDLIQVNEGDYIPIDAQIKNGALLLDESMMTGESVPVNKSEKQEVFAGTLILRGNAVLMVLKKSNNTVLQNIIYTIKQAQMNKPNIQRLSDKVSAWFVPLVLGISVLTFLLNYFAFDIDFSHSIMRCIAVLVIACPCAMGLATPTAIAAGVGKAARKGILLKGGAVLEHFSNIKTLALDKTGTLTNGDFVINDLRCSQGTTEAEAYRLIASLEKTSSHPIATSLLHQLKDYGPLIKWTTSKESNGLGIEGTDEKGDVYKFGSAAFALDTPSDDERLYLSKNSRQLASLFLADGMKENVKQSIDYFKKEGIQVKLISGDSEMRCKQIAYEAGIEEYHWRKLPMQKLEMLQQTKASGLVAMAGDGINDAPSLATADVGISFQSGSGIAQNSASIVLMNEHNFQSLAEAHIISKNTVKTIKQNLFWAFFYNVVAIPMAAIGYLSPIMAAFSMAFSDVVIIANSIRFYHKKS